MISGGVAPNVVPPSAQAEVMFRTVSDGARVREAVGPLEARVAIDHVLEAPPVHLKTVPGYDVTVWYGLCGPGNMPRPLVAKINADLAKAVSSPETAKRLADVGIEAAPGTPEQFSTFVRGELAKWAKVIKDAGVTAD